MCEMIKLNKINEYETNKGSKEQIWIWKYEPKIEQRERVS